MNDIDPPALPDPPDLSAGTLRDRTWNHLIFPVGKDRDAARLSDWRVALSHDHVVLRTTHRVNAEDRKRVHDLSMEFLIGRLVRDEANRRGTAISSPVSGGCVVSGASVDQSLPYTNVHFNSCSRLSRVVALPGVDIGRHAVLKSTGVSASPRDWSSARTWRRMAHACAAPRPGSV